MAELATSFKDKSLALKLRLFNVVSERHKLVINLAILLYSFCKNSAFSGRWESLGAFGNSRAMATYSEIRKKKPHDFKQNLTFITAVLCEVL